MLRWIAGLLAVLVLLGAYISFTRHNDLLAARAQLEEVQTRAEAQLRVNDMVRKYAAEQKARADSAEAVARRSVVVAERADRELAVAPTARDSLTAAIAGRDAYRSAFHAQVAASAALRARGDSLQAANADLARVVRDYGNASDAVLAASKPSFLQRLIPDVGAGCTAGYDPIRHQVGTVCGPSLHWSF
jgi:hypothetical protein